MGSKRISCSASVLLCVLSFSGTCHGYVAHIRMRPVARTPRPIAQFRMPDFGGIDARTQRRMSEMKRADEPLVEEMRGLAALGIVGGFVLLPILGINCWLGMLLGWQFAPLLSIIDGSSGEACRKAGWEANARCVAAKERIVKEWEAADAKYHLRERWASFDARGKWAAFSSQNDLPGKAAALWALFLAKIWTPLKGYAVQALAWLEERGMITKARTFWLKTGLPAWYKRQVEAYRDNQLLRARMRQME